jgi:hypothetical protein
MKSIVITALAIGLGLTFFFYRRRLKLAILVAGGLYLLLTVARLIVLREEVDRFAELGLALGGLGLVWLVTNVATRLLQRRRSSR